MKWRGRRRSSNVDDRRGSGSAGGGFGGINPLLLGPLLKLLFSKTGLIIVAVLLGISFFTGYNPLNLITGNSTASSNQAYLGSAKENQLAEFSGTILASTEDIWNQQLSNYREPTLVLYTNSVRSACGSATSASGPFYCPGDEKLYIDLSFFADMEQQLNAPGDFAQAYVIAHEVGHHIQNLMGITDKMQTMRQNLSKSEYNKYSVRLELQADFLAGVWAHHAQKNFSWMEVGDLSEALNAANAIGDDRLQKKSTGQIIPDSFTHGTSEQRMRWFKKGFETGDLNQGNTFTTSNL